MSSGEIFGHPQTCVYPDVCLGIAHVSGKAPSLGTRGLADTQCICPFHPKESVGRKGQIHCVSTGPLALREGLYQIHGQSLNTHRGKHRSGQECPEYGGTGCTGPTWNKLVPIWPSWTYLAKLVVILLCFAFLEKHLWPTWTKLVKGALSRSVPCTPDLGVSKGGVLRGGEISIIGVGARTGCNN